MPVTLSGWPVLYSGDKRLGIINVPGSKRRFTVRVDYDGVDTGRLFAALIADIHAYVQNIDSGVLDDWSHVVRQARAGGGYSDHSSGFAVDINSAKFGSTVLGNRNVGMDWLVRTRKYLEVIKILRRYRVFGWGGLKFYKGVNTGGDYNSLRYSDPMHFFLKPGTTPNDVRKVIRRLGIRPDGTRPSGPVNPRVDGPVFVGEFGRGAKGPHVSAVQKSLGIKDDGVFGAVTASAVNAFVSGHPRLGAADGIVRLKTYERLVKGV